MVTRVGRVIKREEGSYSESHKLGREKRKHQSINGKRGDGAGETYHGGYFYRNLEDSIGDSSHVCHQKRQPARFH